MTTTHTGRRARALALGAVTVVALALAGCSGTAPGAAATSSCQSAWPPNHVWMPNHPQATSARRTAGTLAPSTPNEARAKTGNGMP